MAYSYGLPWTPYGPLLIPLFSPASVPLSPPLKGKRVRVLEQELQKQVCGLGPKAVGSFLIRCFFNPIFGARGQSFTGAEHGACLVSGFDKSAAQVPTVAIETPASLRDPSRYYGSPRWPIQSSRWPIGGPKSRKSGSKTEAQHSSSCWKQPPLLFQLLEEKSSRPWVRFWSPGWPI